MIKRVAIVSTVYMVKTHNVECLLGGGLVQARIFSDSVEE
jgi:hypothetical protein